ncbi:laminin B domain-containing protein [Antarctobacter heliothermus]|uniref:Laminin B (Domain IV) n=1 Tax=Antarctobacter heliothermus TaxID=74033 RepID=A0A239L576_9RHOB|nr:laminin B domain-containing protein [Antarctobacter heliothermus]SNT24839.1 Laminin B (Domain IV) [Antarctobacter heliothermus]
MSGPRTLIAALALALAVGLAPMPGQGQSTAIEGASGGSALFMAGWTVDLGAPEQRDGGLYLAPPAEGRTSYYIAPPSFTGSLSDKVALVFEKKSWGGTYYRDGDTWRGDVVIYGGSMVAAYTIAEDHSGEWRRYVIPLADTGWTLSGRTPSLKQILSNVTRIEIRAEYGAGDDFSILRNVELR